MCAGTLVHYEQTVKGLVRGPTSVAAAASTSGRSSEVPSVLARRRRSARCCDSLLRSSPDIFPRRDTDR